MLGEDASEPAGSLSHRGSAHVMANSNKERGPLAGIYLVFAGSDRERSFPRQGVMTRAPDDQ